MTLHTQANRLNEVSATLYGLFTRGNCNGNYIDIVYLIDLAKAYEIEDNHGDATIPMRLPRTIPTHLSILRAVLATYFPGCTVSAASVPHAHDYAICQRSVQDLLTNCGKVIGCGY